jgi:hypothetical protein
MDTHEELTKNSLIANSELTSLADCELRTAYWRMPNHELLHWLMPTKTLLWLNVFVLL